MSDALANALGGEQQQQQQQQPNPGEQQQQQQQQPNPGEQQQQQQASAFPAWMGEVPADLQTDDLKSRAARFQSPLDMFKAFTETQDWARGRVALPKEGDAASFAEFAAKIRPEKAEDYKIDVPDGNSTELADAFRPVAYDAGLHPEQVTKVVGFWNQMQADMVSKQTQQGNTELKSIEMEMGESAYAQRLEAASNLLRNAGVEIEDIAPAMEKIGGGAGKAMQALFKMAEATGELAKVDGVTVAMRIGSMNAQQAQAQVDGLMNDSEFMGKARTKGTPEAKKWEDLNAIIARGQ
ncbi:hypothetical protein [uncultured Sphingorhabdus sp.]|uniref:hypothetical protein n=1 Tax=uncultured Sphingorhabdus sp. TaxID=1686106 RepID=UPI002616D3E1|nr:hypothetical protein [uncultured Sphingorhabdus sp.]HMS22108.1 hypothetical protein [Sphingorhabdus sp.]